MLGYSHCSLGFCFYMRDACKGITFKMLMMLAVVSLATGIWTEGMKAGWTDEGISIGFVVLLVQIVVSAVSDYHKEGMRYQNVNAPKAKIKLEVRPQCHHFDIRNVIFWLLLPLAACKVTTVAASPPMAAVAAQIPQNQNECWTAFVGTAVAIVGVAVVMIVSASWLRIQQQGLPQRQAILDIAGAFETNIVLQNIVINARSFEDILPQAIPE